MKTVCFGLLVVFFCNAGEAPKPVVISDYCSNSKTIVASSRDTPETLAQIRAENAKRRKHCPKS